MFSVAIVYYVVFRYAPLYGVIIAFKEFNFSRGIWGSPWTGLENFRFMFTLPSFWQVLRNTLLINLYKLVIGFPSPIIFALLLNELTHKGFKRVVQTISYLPHFVSWVVLGGLFLQFLSPSIGPINIVLQALGMKPVFFMGNPRLFRGVLVLTDVWKKVGWAAIIYLAALASINPELYEAAVIDGANRFQRMTGVTLPSLMPVITIMFIMATGQIIDDDFDQIFNMYNPAVYSVADVIGTYTYRVGLVDFRYSFATAGGLFKTVVALALVSTSNLIANKVNEYGLW